MKFGLWYEIKLWIRGASPLLHLNADRHLRWLGDIRRQRGWDA